jgi:hypothetical protein
MSESHWFRWRVTCVLAIGGGLGAFSCGNCVETPTVASLAPNSAKAGTSGIELVVNGNHFQQNSTVNWNGSALATTFVSGHQLKATIATEDLATPATVAVTVVSPPAAQPVTFNSGAASSSPTDSMTADCAGGTSQPMNFAVSP